MGSEPTPGRDFPASEPIFQAQEDCTSDEIIYWLSEKAGVDKPFQLSSWLFFRALNEDKKDAVDLLGVSGKTLRRWEWRMDENLTRDEEALLVKESIVMEYEERIGDVS